MTPIKQVSVTKISQNTDLSYSDIVAKEEPLEIRLAYGSLQNRQKMSLAVTMRTPGDDTLLVIGFLFTEGIINNLTDILSIDNVPTNDKKSEGNIILVHFSPQLYFEPERVQRHFYTTSSCGVCGKTSIEAVQQNCDWNLPAGQPTFSKEILFLLSGMLRDKQSIFAQTGGIHGAALCDDKGQLILVTEDIGRHNAVDKLIGSALKEGLFPLSNYLILVSGRAGFELVQKSVVAGISLMAAIGAPSSLAIGLAEEAGMTLVGFLKKDRFNIYSHRERIK